MTFCTLSPYYSNNKFGIYFNNCCRKCLFKVIAFVSLMIIIQQLFTTFLSVNLQKLVSYPLLRKSSKDCSLSVHDSESSKASEQAVNVNLSEFLFLRLSLLAFSITINVLQIFYQYLFISSTEVNTGNLESCSQGVNPHIALSPLSKRVLFKLVYVTIFYDFVFIYAISCPTVFQFNDIEIRPVTAETADSGYPEDENVILSDRSGTNSQPTVSCDVSDISNHQTLDEGLLHAYYIIYSSLQKVVFSIVCCFIYMMHLIIDARPSAGYDESGSFQSVIPDVASSSASGRLLSLHF